MPHATQSVMVVIQISNLNTTYFENNLQSNLSIVLQFRDSEFSGLLFMDEQNNVQGGGGGGGWSTLNAKHSQIDFPTAPKQKMISCFSICFYATSSPIMSRSQSL